MTSKVYSLTLVGLEAQIIEVEVDIGKGKRNINIIGLPDKAITEARDRIIPALRNSNCIFPKGNVTVNLAPASIPKSGSYFDLPIIMAILLETGQIEFDHKKTLFIGEVSLDGSLRAINGVVTAVYSIKNHDFDSIFLPLKNANEASLIKDIDVYGADSINSLINHFRGNTLKKHEFKFSKPKEIEPNKYDFQYVKGQEHAKRAVEIACAGGHNCLLSGVPGSGKTFVARCIPGILPKMNLDESIDVTRIYSLVGKIDKESPLIEERPFRSPHHTSSQVSLIGGGAIPKPGEVTLAHRGVLFLDEFPEFNNKTLEVLRQPLEDRFVQISRANGTIVYPCNFMLIAAMNPCKCGFRGDPDKECSCSVSDYMKYQKTISGPIMDRIDLQVKIPKVRLEKLTSPKPSEASSEVKKRVEEVRKIQYERFKGTSNLTNSDMDQLMIKKFIALNKSSLELLKSAVDSMNLSARSYFRILKVSRTIADIEKSESVRSEHIAEALTYRM